MKHILSILLLACISLSSYAQTPYDSFAPETDANGERLASVPGGGGWCNMSQDAISSPATQHESYLMANWEKTYLEVTNPFDYPQEPASPLTDNVDINNIDYPDLQYGCSLRKLQSLTLEYNQDILLQSMMDNCEIHGAEQDIYYTHSDHLGSANWITDKNGAPVQYLHYLPYGQLLANQQATGSSYDERYKFTGKERDEESGYDYFGARYYIPPLLHWSSVDPLVDNDLHISPYAYCNWNPVKYVDKEGARSLPMESTYNGWTARVDSWFGPRNTGQKGASTYHRGLDFNYSCGGDGDYGTPILATHEGWAHIVDNIDGKAGRYVEITSEDGTVRTRYLHLSAISIAEGQYVLESDKIGEMGGSASGNEHKWNSHLHYEIQKLINDKWTSIDPVEGKDKNINNILDPQSIIDVDDNIYCGGELQEIIIVNTLDL